MTPAESTPRRKPTVTDRLPPHSQECEQGIIGCCLLDPSKVGTCIEMGVTDDLFYDLCHQTIFKTILELYEDGIPLDIITLQERLNLWQLLAQVGGLAYLAVLPDATPSAENIETYIETVRDKHSLRRMIHACTETVARIYDYEGDVDALLDEVEQKVFSVAEGRTRAHVRTVQEIIHEVIADIEDAHANPGQITGLRTGFHDLDAMLNGLQPGNMIVLAGRPSLGKTSLMLNIADHVACVQHLPVGIISMEMTDKELVKRMVYTRARVNGKLVDRGQVHESEFSKLTNASGTIAHAPIFIDDTGGQSINRIRATARRWKQQKDIKLLGVDYLQLGNASGSARRVDNREQEVSAISNGIKNLAKELGIPVLALCQLNREVEREKNHKPRMSSLRESGSLEQDADVVGILYRDPDFEPEQAEEDLDAIPVNLSIGKQRNGPTGDVRFMFMKPFTRFESRSHISEIDVPQQQHPHEQEMALQ